MNLYYNIVKYWKVVSSTKHAAIHIILFVQSSRTEVYVACFGEDKSDACSRELHCRELLQVRGATEIGMQSCSLQCEGCSRPHSWPGWLQVQRELQVKWYQWPNFAAIGWSCLTARRFGKACDWIFAKCNYLTNEGWVCMNILCFTMTMNCSTGLGLGRCWLDATFHLKLFYNF